MRKCGFFYFDSKIKKMRFQRLNDNKASDTLEFDDFDDEVFKTEDEDLILRSQNANDSTGMVTIEGLRRSYNSCSKCGVSWYDDHVSLDCSECGGYAMCRPCPTCKGKCGNTWRRDVKSSHASKNAEWHGTCLMNNLWRSQRRRESKQRMEDKNANFQRSSYRHLSHHHIM